MNVRNVQHPGRFRGRDKVFQNDLKRDIHYFLYLPSFLKSLLACIHSRNNSFPKSTTHWLKIISHHLYGNYFLSFKRKPKALIIQDLMRKSKFTPSMGLFILQTLNLSPLSLCPSGPRSLHNQPNEENIAPDGSWKAPGRCDNPSLGQSELSMLLKSGRWQVC